MKEVKITIKNYRSFSDVSPLVIDLGPHFTALVGTNNSGKSTFLRMFYEFRNLWPTIFQNLVNIFLRDWHTGVNYLGISDPEEIFSNTNDRPLSIDVKIIEAAAAVNEAAPFLSRVIATCDRASPTSWSFRCFSSVNPKKQIEVEPNFPARKKSDTEVELPGQLDLDCFAFLEVMRAFSEALYIGPFRNAINEGAGDYFDLAVGTQFISTWNMWKTGGVKKQNLAILRVTKEIQQIFEFEQLEINASEVLKTLNISIDNRPYLLSELGSGLTQFIIVFGNAGIKTPSFILIDEPELNLHPSLQIDFITALASFSSKGIIFATQSVGLARSVAERIYSFQKGDDGSLVREFEGMTNYAEFVGELSFSSFKDMGCDRILLVEGVHDVKTIQQFLRMLKKDHQTVVLPLGGDQLARGGVEAELSELTRLSENISAVVDSERLTKGAEPSRQRRDFEKVCQKLDIKVCLTQRRAIENYFSDGAVKAQLGEKYKSLGPYDRLQDCPMSWDKSAGWRIARIMTFDDIRDTDLGRFLSGI